MQPTSSLPSPTDSTKDTAAPSDITSSGIPASGPVSDLASGGPGPNPLNSVDGTDKSSEATNNTDALNAPTSNLGGGSDLTPNKDTGTLPQQDPLSSGLNNDPVAAAVPSPVITTPQTSGGLLDSLPSNSSSAESPLPAQAIATSNSPQMEEIKNRIEQVTNILVTVRSSPSVDELAAALALTMELDNSGKHATAVFGGKIPDAMGFLKPEKTFENNVHSLRDFIISLNKDKADKLRFAKDGDIVKIYITPFKATISPKDLQYGEGDFNVEMVIAIGVYSKDELDKVITAHGRILHDATVTTITPGAKISQLGSINWSDPTAGTASVMAMQLMQAIKPGQPLKPEVATALLTGLVAATDRFSNQKTTPEIMKASAELMSNGADHKLVTENVRQVFEGADVAVAAKASTSSSVKMEAAQNVGAMSAAKPEDEQELILDVDNANGSKANDAYSAMNVDGQVNTEQAKAEPVAPPTISNPTPNIGGSGNLSDNLPAAQSPIEMTTPLSTQSTNLNTSDYQNAADLPDQAPSPTIAPTPYAEPANNETPDTIASNTAITEMVPTQDTISASSAEQDILNDIDKIYGAQPFDPANNPRHDLGSEVILPDEETNTAEAADQNDGLPSPNPTPDTAVQQQQEMTNNASAPGVQPTQNIPAGVAGLPSVPGVGVPPSLTPPPPPPPPPAIGTNFETNPGLSFDPTKPAKPVEELNGGLIPGTGNIAANSTAQQGALPQDNLGV